MYDNSDKKRKEAMVFCIYKHHTSNKMEYGNKANTLIELKNKGFSIPNFVATGKSFYDEFLKESGVYEDAQMVLVKSAWLKEIFKNIKTKIETYKITESIENKLMDLTKNLKFPVSVRSSCSVEDSQINSGAGLYYTKLNVQKENLTVEVKNVIASLFNENSLIALSNQTYHPDDYFMGVIVQEMISPNISGVAFTNDPVTNDDSKIIIEAVDGCCDKLVSGTSKSRMYVMKKYDDSDTNDIKELNDLKKVLLQLENYFHYPVDVEWALCNGKIYILQCRPVIIKRNNMKLDTYKIFPMSALSEDIYEYLGDLKPRLQKWLKKAKFYKFCQQNQIKTPSWQLLSFSSYAKPNFKEVLSEYNSPYIIYHLNNKYLDICRKKDLEYVLDNYCERKKGESLCVSIRECLPNEVACISQMHFDKTIHIECVSGKMSLLNNGVVAPTRYTANLKGEIINSSIKRQKVYRFSEEKLEFAKTDEEQLIELNKSIIIDIAIKTQLFNERFGPCSVEWWIYNGIPYAADISILSKDVDTKGGMIVSPGKVRGIVRKFPEKDKSVMDDLNMFSAISVSDTVFNTDKVDSLKEFSSLISEWKREGKVILYSEMPYIYLVPFVNDIDGFIFEEASLLCHLSLIIRESHKPALSLQGGSLSDCMNKKIFLDADEGAITIGEEGL